MKSLSLNKTRFVLQEFFSSLGDGDSTGWGKYPDEESTGISSIPSPGRGSTPTRKKSSVKESKGRYNKVLSDYGAHLKKKGIELKLGEVCLTTELLVIFVFREMGTLTSKHC